MILIVSSELKNHESLALLFFFFPKLIIKSAVPLDLLDKFQDNTDIAQIIKT